MRFAKVLTVAALGVALMTAGCVSSDGGTPSAGGGSSATSTTPAASGAGFPVTVTDDLGNRVTIDKRPERIVSLAPGDTEIIYALGLMPKLVGVTTYDDYPPEVTKLPKVGDFMNPNLEAIAAAKPDLVLVTGGVQQSVVKKLQALGAKVVAIDPSGVAKLLTSIATVGKVTGAVDPADAVVKKMTEGIDAIHTKLGDAKPVTCFVEIAQNPLYTAGTDTLTSDLVRIAGGVNVVKQPGFVGYSLEQLLKDDPQVYFATKGSVRNPADMKKRPGYDKLGAVKAGRVYVLDDNLVSRPGPRIIAGILEIARGLHPSQFAGSGSGGTN